MFLAAICFRDAGKSSYLMRDDISCIIWRQRCVVKKIAGGSDFLSWNDPFCGSAATLADSLRKYFKGLHRLSAKGNARGPGYSRYWSIKWYGGRGRFETPGK